ncbi:ABC transporter ATP-binding protein [Nocardiopsis sp. NPDC006198]|uniref:ABC transporter ATP-binding protein n=1 Tax=Nocardiopsis sp. NPDC006198 TaxID=3154472 RepID=UPI0033BB9043
MQTKLVGLGIFWGCVWMASLGLTPLALGYGIDAISSLNTQGVLGWAGVIVGLGLLATLGSLLRHRCETIGKLEANYLVVRLVARQATRLGARLSDRVAVGEVAAVGTADVSRIGALPRAMAGGIGSAVTILMVAVVLLSTSVPLGLVVLIGAPALLIFTGPLLSPLHRRVGHYRDLQGTLTVRANDIVAGLRVLRGIGGEEMFSQRYRFDSQRVRRAGVRVARLESLLPAAQVVLPGILVVAVVWIGGRLAVDGAITGGDLVAAYGYAAFLQIPMRIVTADLQVLVGANVAARHVVQLLALEPDPTAGTERVPLSEDLTLHDRMSGLTVHHGRLTAVVSRSPEEAAELAARLGRYTGEAVTLGETPLEVLPVEQVRQLILVVDDSQTLFTGMLRDEFDGLPDHELTEVLRAAHAQDILSALPDGLRTMVTERGTAFSGGEQQRLRLARALAAEPEILVLVEPTSAVDANTEAVIAEGIRRIRAGRTTVVMSTSPLVLDRADDVAYVDNGRVVATGTHSQLLAGTPGYAETVTRDVT